MNVRIEPCDLLALRAALRLVNLERNSGRRPQADAGVPGGWDAVAINLDRIAEDAADSGDQVPGCDDPGAHRPGCQCNGGEPRL